MVLHSDGVCFSGSLNIDCDWDFTKELYLKVKKALRGPPAKNLKKADPSVLKSKEDPIVTDNEKEQAEEAEECPCCPIPLQRRGQPGRITLEEAVRIFRMCESNKEIGTDCRDCPLWSVSASAVTVQRKVGKHFVPCDLLLAVQESLSTIEDNK